MKRTWPCENLGWKVVVNVSDRRKNQCKVLKAKTNVLSLRISLWGACNLVNKREASEMEGDEAR